MEEEVGRLRWAEDGVVARERGMGSSWGGGRKSIRSAMFVYAATN